MTSGFLVHRFLRFWEIMGFLCLILVSIMVLVLILHVFYCYRDCNFFVIGFVGNLISGVRVLMQFLFPPGNIIR